MKLDDLKEEWKKDCEIDDIELDKSSLEIPKLHAKYSELLTDSIIQQKNLSYRYNTLLKDKWLWFNGKMDEETIKEKGWKDDPFDGLKILKNDMQIFFNADPELQQANAQQEYMNITVNFLKDCLTNITWRHQTIKNTIDWRKFMAGQ
ncbi:uncharacterized protein METZ01_LOCUS221232 [marine metagenome]|uniref:Uncharacterized protein n=1 Tax=marine metagenome TaxID=408172 RepID=A0A382FZB7_9ZZZZ